MKNNNDFVLIREQLQAISEIMLVWAGRDIKDMGELEKYSVKEISVEIVPVKGDEIPLFNRAIKSITTNAYQGDSLILKNDMVQLKKLRLVGDETAYDYTFIPINQIAYINIYNHGYVHFNTDKQVVYTYNTESFLPSGLKIRNKNMDSYNHSFLN